VPDHSTYEAWDLEALSGVPNYQEWIVHLFRPYLRGDAVEIGAGRGVFSERLLHHVDQLQMVEPATNLVSELKKEFAGNHEVEIIAETAENYLRGQPEASRDCIVMVNVLEHIEDDAGVMEELFRVLKPGGHLLVFVPALRWLFSAMDVALGHHRRYHKNSLASLASQVGFEVVSVRYFDFLGVIPWWIIYTLAEKTRFNPGLSKLYDRLVVPVGRVIEAVVPPPMGKNVVLIAKKSES